MSFSEYFWQQSGNDVVVLLITVAFTVFVGLVLGSRMEKLRKRILALEVELRVLAGRDVARIDAVQRLTLDRQEAEAASKQ